MGFSLIPKDEGFFDLFEKMAGIVEEASREFAEMFAKADKGKVERVKQLETAGDDVTQEISKALARSFLTPLEPEDIHRLAVELDDVLDEMEDSAFRFSIYVGDGKAPEPAVQLAKTIREACLQVNAAVKLLRHDLQSDALQVACKEIFALEMRGDRIFRDAETALFATPGDPITVIKNKDLFEHLEGTLNACRKIANTILELVLKIS